MRLTNSKVTNALQQEPSSLATRTLSSDVFVTGSLLPLQVLCGHQRRCNHTNAMLLAELDATNAVKSTIIHFYSMLMLN